PLQVQLAGNGQVVGFGIEMVVVKGCFREPAIGLLRTGHIQDNLAIRTVIRPGPIMLGVVDVRKGLLRTDWAGVWRPKFSLVFNLARADRILGFHGPPGFAVPPWLTIARVLRGYVRAQSRRPTGKSQERQ